MGVEPIFPGEDNITTGTSYNTLQMPPGLTETRACCLSSYPRIRGKVEPVPLRNQAKSYFVFLPFKGQFVLVIHLAYRHWPGNGCCKTQTI